MDPVSPTRSQPLMDPLFNVIFIEAFGCGLYTLLVFQTICKLYSKGGKLLYSSALVILWITLIAGLAGDWVKSRARFIPNNGPFIALSGNQINISPLFTYISGVIAVGISDAIIIRRCYILWQSRVMLGILIVLLCGTITLLVSANLFQNAPLGELIQALCALSACITSTFATFLIVLKITLVTRQNQRRHHYSRIIEILLQSAGIESLCTLALAILSLIAFAHPLNLSTTSGRLCYQLLNYLTIIRFQFVGLSPTYITFRVAEEPS